MEELRLINEENPKSGETLHIDQFNDGLVSCSDDIEIYDNENEKTRHSQYDALVAMIYDVKERLDRFIELYGNNINPDDVLVILTRMTSFIDELKPDDTNLDDFWIDYSKAEAAIGVIEREVAEKNLNNQSEIINLKKKRFFHFKRDYKFYIPGCKYIFREDNHGSTPEHKGLHFALEDKDELGYGVVVTLDEFGVVHLEPHGDKKRGKECIENLLMQNNIEDLQIINEFTKYKFGEKPVDKRRKYSKDSKAVHEDLPTKYYFESGN